MAAPSKARKRVAPVACALILIALCGAVIALAVWAAAETPIPLVFVILYAGGYVGAIGALVAVLVQRIKEINGGEEDEAVQY